MPSIHPRRRTAQPLIALTLLLALAGLTGCSAEVGSERWCGAMAEKPKGDWTANEAMDYAEHCLID
jgi:hypothetical protein